MSLQSKKRKERRLFGGLKRFAAYLMSLLTVSPMMYISYATDGDSNIGEKEKQSFFDKAGTIVTEVVRNCIEDAVVGFAISKICDSLFTKAPLHENSKKDSTIESQQELLKTHNEAISGINSKFTEDDLKRYKKVLESLQHKKGEMKKCASSQTGHIPHL